MINETRARLRGKEADWENIWIGWSTYKKAWSSMAFIDHICIHCGPNTLRKTQPRKTKTKLKKNLWNDSDMHCQIFGFLRVRDSGICYQGGNQHVKYCIVMVFLLLFYFYIFTIIVWSEWVMKRGACSVYLCKKQK
jgi:hypothetical protein